jgi:replication-associated recombination protein RarA
MQIALTRQAPRIVDYLFNNDVKFLFLDEVEKMSKADQNVLLNVMEAGMQIDITNGTSLSG